MDGPKRIGGSLGIALVLVTGGGQAAPKDRAAPPALWDGSETPLTRTAAGGQLFKVTGVEADDTLNMRARADAHSALVSVIAPDGHGIRVTGRKQQIGSSTWWEISYAGQTGWVNARFLAPEAAPGPAQPPAARPAAPPLPVERKPLVADPYGRAAPAGGFPEDLVCFLNQPIWRVELRKDGTVTCTEMCKAPAGLRVAAAEPVKGHRDAWSVTVRDSGGAPFMSLGVRRTDRCADDMSNRVSPYEVTARRAHGPSYRGCCTTLVARRP